MRHTVSATGAVHVAIKIEENQISNFFTEIVCKFQSPMNIKLANRHRNSN